MTYHDCKTVNISVFMIIRKGSVQRFAITLQLNMTEKINSASWSCHGLLKAGFKEQTPAYRKVFFFIEFRYKTAEIAT